MKAPRETLAAAHLIQIGSVADLKGLGLRDACDCAFDSAHQIDFIKEVSHKGI